MIEGADHKIDRYVCSAAAMPSPERIGADHKIDRYVCSAAAMPSPERIGADHKIDRYVCSNINGSPPDFSRKPAKNIVFFSEWDLKTPLYKGILFPRDTK